MFDGFSAPRDGATRTRLAASAGASLLVWILAGAGLALAGASAAPQVKKRVAVAFRPPPPPPPPAAEPAPPPQPPPRPRPPPPRTLATREVAGLPPPAPLVAPVEIPLEQPAEAEPTGEAIAVAAARPAGYGGAGGPPSPAPGPRPTEPIHLPEHATPPVPAAGNPQPEYPLDARARGLSGTVVLRIVIDERGAVGRVEVLRGEEPFASAAVSAVRRWRYEPARLDGAPVAHFRIVRVPFRLQNG